MNPIDAEPFFEATAVLPSSPGLALPDRIELTAWRREPGSVRARLLDARGEPARGTILITRPFDLGGHTHFAGTTDRRGEVVFRDVPGGRLDALGFIEGESFPPDARDPGAIPDTETLRGRRFIPDVPIDVRSGAEAAVTLALRPTGYVRGVYRPPSGRKAKEYVVGAWRPESMTPIACRYDAGTGRFLCGPLTPGTIEIAAGNARVATDAISSPKPRRLDVPSGAVVEVDLDPPGAPPEPGPVLPGQGAASLRDAIAAMPAGSVERAGGGPAAGAHALLFVPGHDGPTAVGVADASGRLTWGGLPFGGDRPAPTPGRPTAVVWMPGETGPRSPRSARSSRCA